MIHLLRQPANEGQITEMLELHEIYLKVAVDVRREIVAGGGEFHADCEAILIEDGSRQGDVWGADWFPESREVRFAALINIKPKQNRVMEIQDPAIRAQVERIVRKLLESS